MLGSRLFIHYLFQFHLDAFLSCGSKWFGDWEFIILRQSSLSVYFLFCHFLLFMFFITLFEYGFGEWFLHRFMVQCFNATNMFLAFDYFIDYILGFIQAKDDEGWCFEVYVDNFNWFSLSWVLVLPKLLWIVVEVLAFFLVVVNREEKKKKWTFGAFNLLFLFGALPARIVRVVIYWFAILLSWLLRNWRRGKKIPNCTLLFSMKFRELLDLLLCVCIIIIIIIFGIRL